MGEGAGLIVVYFLDVTGIQSGSPVYVTDRAASAGSGGRVNGVGVEGWEDGCADRGSVTLEKGGKK